MNFFMSTRRDFLKRSIIGAAAAVTAPVIAADRQESNGAVYSVPEVFQPLRVSMLSYSFHGLFNAGMMDLFHFFETCKYRYHLDAADIWNGMFASTDDAYIKKVFVALEDRQLKVPDIACDGCHILAAGNDDAAKLKADQDRYMQIAKQLGTGFVRFDAGPYDDGRGATAPWTDREFDFLVKRYRELAQFAYDNGFKVGAENHWGPEKYWPNLEKLIKAVDHPGFAICVHISGWTGSRDEIDAADKAAAPYAAHTHFPWDTCEGPLLEKMLNLRNAGYPGYYSIEQHSAQNEFNLVGAQLSKVTAILTSWNRGGSGEFYPPREQRNRDVPW
jgi:sugar phosphate isomerase/epimerase